MKIYSQFVPDISVQNRGVGKAYDICQLEDASRTVVGTQAMTCAQLNYFIHIFVEKLLYRQLAHQRAMLVIEQVLAFLIDTILVLVDRFVDAELLFGGKFQIF